MSRPARPSMTKSVIDGLESLVFHIERDLRAGRISKRERDSIYSGLGWIDRVLEREGKIRKPKEKLPC